MAVLYLRQYQLVGIVVGLTKSTLLHDEGLTVSQI